MAAGKNKGDGDSVLDHAKPPKNLGSGCVAFELKELRAKASSLLDMLSTKTVDDETENSVLVDFREGKTARLHYVRNGAYATADVEAKTYSHGAFAVDAAVFKAIKGQAQIVYFVMDKSSNSVGFRCGATSGSVQMLSGAKEYLKQAPEPFKAPETILQTAQVTDVFSKLMFSSFDPALPAMGLPLNIVSGKDGLVVTSNDNIVGSLYRKPGKALDKFSACVPGQVFIKIAKNMPHEQIKCGFGTNMFRVRCLGMEVVHPLVTYDLVDLLSWLDEDAKQKPVFEVVVPVHEFADAIESAMCMSVIDKTESNISVEFGEDSGKVSFLGSSANSKSKFSVTKTLSGKSRERSFTTNGRRILSFVALLRGFKEFRLRVSQGRAYMFAPDESFTFLVPLGVAA